MINKALLYPVTRLLPESSLPWKSDGEHDELAEEAYKIAVSGLKPGGDLSLTSVFSVIGNTHLTPLYFQNRKLDVLLNFPLPQKEKESLDVSWLNGKDISIIEPGKLLDELRYHFTNVSCGIKELNCVSLFEVCKLTAGLATCMTASRHTLFFVGFDISGIQSFLYDIVSKNAAKNLKGRSFYIQLLVESVQLRIQQVFKVTEASRIYSSGSSFFYLLPQEENTEKLLSELKHELFIEFYEKTGAQLLPCLAWSKTDYAHLKGEKLTSLWSDLHLKMCEEKKARYHLLIQQNYNAFFSATGKGELTDRDDITGEELEADNKVQLSADLVVSKETAHQIELGKCLWRTDFWGISKGNQTVPEALTKVKLLGYTHYFLTKENFQAAKSKLTETDIRSLNKKEKDCIQIFFGGNRYPVTGEQPKTFDQLVDVSHVFGYLGVLRMDVDSLGKMFIEGFSKEDLSLLHYSELSNRLEYFFKGYINTLWAEKKFSDHITIIYSGGDDLLAIGDWIHISEFAERLREAFRKFTGNHPTLTLSCGIAIVKPKFPIKKAAQMAGEAEDKAKDHEFTNEQISQKKNSFSILGVPLNWDHEWPVVRNLKQEIIKQLDNGNGLPKGFLTYVYNLEEQYQNHKKNKDNPRWMWHMAYQLSRSAQRQNGATKLFLEQIKNDAFTNAIYGNKHKYHYLILLNLACRLAELETRKSK